jgi:hypothetical protein
MNVTSQRHITQISLKHTEYKGQNHLASYLQGTGYRMETNLAAANRDV